MVKKIQQILILAFIALIFFSIYSLYEATTYFELIKSSVLLISGLICSYFTSEE